MTTPFFRRPGQSCAKLALIAIAGWLVTLGFAVAQPALAQSLDADPPARVARLADFGGQVWFYSPDAGEWVAAVPNQPLTNGDRLATDAGARAEVEVGSTVLRLDAGTELGVVAIDDGQLALELHAGSVAARVVDAAGTGDFTVDTDEGRFVVGSAGSYRFDRGDRVVFATVYSGQARYEGPNSALPLVPGQRVQFWLDANGVAQYSLGAPANDGFAAWANELDRRMAANVSVRYVSPEMTGAADLDRYGRWEQSPEDGPVWIPTVVAADWAPYSAGRWAFVRPWGWTWIDDARWGFAPFHYGRWFYARNRWCWAPGTRVARPVYAPALVAWIGGPRGTPAFSGGGRGPAVGWVPLAPREVYMPGYRVSPRYVRNVNFTQVTNVTQINAVINDPQGPRDFANRRIPNAVTVVPVGVVGARQPVGPAAAQWRRTPEVREFGTGSGRTTALLAPPVAPPVGMSSGAEPHAVRPPPGAGWVRPQGDVQGVARPEFPGRDRERGPGRAPPQVLQAQPAQPFRAQPPPQSQPQAAAPTAAAPAAPTIVSPQNGVYPPAGRPADRPWAPRGNGGETQRDLQPTPFTSRSNPVAPPAAGMMTPQPAATAAEQAAQPSMARPTPIRRGDERGGFNPRTAETPANAEQRPTAPRFEQRPAAPLQRPGAEAARPAEMVRPAAPLVQPPPPPVPMPQRAVEAPRPAGIQPPVPVTPAPAAQMVNPRLEQKRNESREPRDAR